MKSLKLIAVLALGFAACSSPEKKKGSEQEQVAPPKSMVEEKLEIPTEINEVLKRNTCLACHKIDSKLIGPAYVDVAKNVSSVDEIIALIREPVPSRYPDYPPMAGIPISDEDGVLIAEWILSLKQLN